MTEPVAHPPAPPPTHPPHARFHAAPGTPAPSRDPVVLVIDDEENCRQLYTRILDSIGCKTHAAHDGPSGLKLWRYVHPDLVILDVMMPGPNGFQMLEQARRESLGGEVIITTALMKKPLIEKAASLRVFSYIAKPFMIQKFVDTVKAALPDFSCEPPASPAAPTPTASEDPTSPPSPLPQPSPGQVASEGTSAKPHDAPAAEIGSAQVEQEPTGSTPETTSRTGLAQASPPPTAPAYHPPTLDAVQEGHHTPQELLMAIRDVMRECARHRTRLPAEWIAYLTSGTSTQIAHLLEDTLAEAEPALRVVLADCVSPNLLRYSVHFVTSLLQDDDPDVACRALCAARGIDDARIRDLVFASLMHREVAVRLQAREVLDSGAYPAPLCLLVRVLTGEACEEMLSMNALRFLQKLAKDPGVFDAALESFPTQPQNVRKYIRQLVAFLVQDEDDTRLVMTLLDERHLQTQKLGVEKVRKDVHKFMARKDASPS